MILSNSVKSKRAVPLPSSQASAVAATALGAGNTTRLTRTGSDSHCPSSTVA